MVDTIVAPDSQTNGNFIEATDDTSVTTSKNVKKMEPNPLVLCGPSGSGKSTIVKAVMANNKYTELLSFSVSHTTRQPRPGELDGREYYFTDRDSMLAEIEAGKFIESAEYSGNLYGTSKESVHKCRSRGKICVLDIDSQGVRSLKKVKNLNPVYVFVKPPSLSTLEERLRSRKTETEESLRRRLEAARQEIEYGDEDGAFDAIIVNDDLAAAVDHLKKIIDTKILKEMKPEEFGCGDTALDEEPEVGGKKAKLAAEAESSRDSTPGVER